MEITVASTTHENKTSGCKIEYVITVVRGVSNCSLCFSLFFLSGFFILFVKYSPTIMELFKESLIEL